MSAHFDDWVERARRTSIESEIMRRGITLRRSGAERIGPCPRCGGTDRFSVNPKLGVWNCRHCKPADIAGDIVGLVQWLDGTEFVRAVETINQEPPPLNGHGHESGGGAPQQVAWYDYQDEAGKLLFQVVRFDPKDFRQRRPLNDGWEWSVKGVRLVPFKLPELIEALASELVVFIVEGEKDVLSLMARGAIATCNPMGAGKWRPEYNQYFRDADVVIIADHDPQAVNRKTGEKLFHPDGRPRLPGRDHATYIAEQLKPVAANVRMFEVNELWPTCGEKADIANYFERGGTIEALNDFVAKCESWSPAPPPVTLKFIDMSAWDSVRAPEREWAVRDRIPARQPTLLSGEGSIGKTILELQLCVAHVLGRDWIGSLPEQGPAIYLGAEDDEDELHRRLEAIVALYNVTFKELINHGLHLLSFAGEDCLLGVPNRSGQIVPTRLFELLLEAIRDIKPKHLGIDTCADVFGGNEIDRAQVRQFLGMLRKLGMTCNGSVVLLAHPSLEGIKSGSGISGSTGWHNSVRARMYFHTPKASDDDDEPDTGLRELEFKKNNYGPVGDTIKLEYHNGIFRPLHSASPIEQQAFERRVEELFIDIFRKLVAQGWQSFSPKKRAAEEYTPRMIAKQPDAAAYKERDFEAAMLRLIAADRIHIEIVKQDRKPRERLALGPAPKDSGMFEDTA
jgi:RecA-family ATPase